MTDNTLLRAAWNAGWNAANPEAVDVPATFDEWLPAYEAMMQDEAAERIAQLQYEAGMYRSLYENAIKIGIPTPPPAPQGEAMAYDVHPLEIVGMQELELTAYLKGFEAGKVTHPTPPTVDGGLSYEQQADELTSAYQDTDARGEWPGSRFLLDALHASGFEIRRKI